MTPTRTAIESLWFEPGTAADAATAANNCCNKGRPYTAHGVKEIWKRAQGEGRLPKIVRPENGFSPRVRDVLRELMKLVRAA